MSGPAERDIKEMNPYQGVPHALGNIKIEGDQILIDGTNKAFAKLFGLDSVSTQNTSLLQLLAGTSTVDQGVLDQILRVHAEALRPAEEKIEFEERKVIYELNGRFIEETIHQGGVVSFRDYSNDWEILKLAVEGSKDSLTKLYNRDHLINQMEIAINNGEEFALVFVDVDWFKDINDQISHGYGDLKLAEVGEVLRKAVRTSTRGVNKAIYELAQQMNVLKDKGRNIFIKIEEPFTDEEKRCGEELSDDVISFLGTPGRWGGDEFVIFLKGAKKDQLDILKKRIEEQLSSIEIEYGFGLEKKKLPVSVGISHSSDIDAERKLTADEMIDRADSIMYRNKLDHHLVGVMDLIRDRARTKDRNGGKIAAKTIEEFNWVIGKALSLYDDSTDISKLDIKNILECSICSLMNYLDVTESLSEDIDLDTERMLEISFEMFLSRLDSSNVSRMIGGNPHQIRGIALELEGYEKKRREWKSLSQSTKIIYILTYYSKLRSLYPDNGTYILGKLESDDRKNDPIINRLLEVINKPKEQ